MDPWQQLFADVRAEHDEETAARAAAKRTEEARAQLAEKVLADLAAQANLRAEELYGRTGRTVAVEFPSHRPVDLIDDGGAHMSFLRLKSGASSLHVYSHRQPGKAPSLHFLNPVKDESAGSHRVWSEPVCMAQPLDEGRYELRELHSPYDTTAGASFTVDDLVLRAFQRLLGLPRRK
jgi:hypothetical protein